MCKLTGSALKSYAASLKIKGRSRMSADALRVACSNHKPARSATLVKRDARRAKRAAKRNK